MYIFIPAIIIIIIIIIVIICIMIIMFADFYVSAEMSSSLHSAKGGAVETGCSDLHYVICCFIT